MINRIKLFIFVASVTFLALSVFPVFAQVIPIVGPCGFRDCVGGENADTIWNFINPFINMALFLVGIFAIIFLIYAGFKYITSQGQEEQAKQAKAQIAYAIIGIIVAFGATLLTETLIDVGEKDMSGAAGGLEIEKYLLPFVDMIFFLIGISAVIFLIYAGYKYISSQGQEEQAKQAKAQIAYAIIGIIVAAFAYFEKETWTIRNLAQEGGNGNAAAVAIANLILPVVSLATLLAGIFTVIFLIYAGFKYITSRGQEEQAKQAKAQIAYAIIGLAVIILSTAITTLISGSLGISYSYGIVSGTWGGTLINGIRIVVNALLTLAGVTAAIFVIVAGVKYITSGGEEDAIRTAKRQLIYAIVGLSVVIISVALINFIFVPLGAAPAPKLAGVAADLMPAIYAIVNALLTLVGIGAAIFVIVAGVKYITSGGEEDAIRTAKRQLIYAVVGLVVVILSSVIVNIIISPF